MTDSDKNLSAQALSKAVEIGLSEQLEEVDNLDVDIKTSFLELTQGKIDSVEVEGQGVVTAKNLRLEKILLTSDHVTVDLLQTILGSFEIKYLENANVQIVLTEADLNHALNSHYLKEKLHNLAIPIGEESLHLDWESGFFSLPGGNIFCLEGKSGVELNTEKKTILFKICFRIKEEGNFISLVSGSYKNDTDLPLEITAAFLEQITNLFNTKILKLQNLEVILEKIKVEAQAATIEFSLETKV